MSNISVIIPVYNEADTIFSFLLYLQKMNSNNIREFLVIDGGSDDGTQKIISDFSKKNEKFKRIDSKKGRAIQMNIGATKSSGHILYFLHADSLPPEKYDKYIIEAIDHGSGSGCFRMKFDSAHWILKIAGWLTQLNWKSCRGGDQSLFVEKKLFLLESANYAMQFLLVLNGSRADAQIKNPTRWQVPINTFSPSKICAGMGETI